MQLPAGSGPTELQESAFRGPSSWKTHDSGCARESAHFREAGLPTRALKRGGLPPNFAKTQRLRGPTRSGRSRQMQLSHSAAGPTAAHLAEVHFLREGGWHVVTVSEGGGRSGGMTSHRGVLHPDEYVDHELLVSMVERELGFTFDEVHSVYRQGPLSATQRELRGRIDARLLALSRAGANMSLLARVLGLVVAPNGNCKAVDRALARARENEAVAA